MRGSPSGVPFSFPVIVLQYAQSEEGEVVLCRILRIEAAQLFGQFQDGLPVGLPSPEQAQLPGYAIYVQVERNEELAGVELPPEAEIDAALVAAHHPAQKHVEAFAGGAARRRGYVFAGASGGVGQ